MAVRLPGLTTVRDTTDDVVRAKSYETLMDMFESKMPDFRDVDAGVGYANHTVMDSFESSSSLDIENVINDIIENGDDKSHGVTALVVFITLYTAITIMSLIGNSLVCLVVVRSKRMRSVTNFFLANQAMSDMLMTILNIPFIAYYQLAGNWPFGLIMCQMADYMGMTSVYVSTFMLTAIALDRHSVIIHPLRPRITMRTAIAIAILIWVLAMALCIPFAVYRDIQPRPLDDTQKMCITTYPGEGDNFARYFALATFLYQCVVPLALTSGAYLHIGMKLWAQAFVGDTIAQQQAANNRAKQRTTRMLVLVVAVFAVCWCPINVYLLVTMFLPKRKNHIMYLSLHWFAMCSVCINPVAFAFLNKNFRSELRASFHCWFKKANLKGRHCSKSFGRTTDLNENSHTADRPTNGVTRYEYVTTCTNEPSSPSCNGTDTGTHETYQLEVKLTSEPDDYVDEVTENKV